MGGKEKIERERERERERKRVNRTPPFVEPIAGPFRFFPSVVESLETFKKSSSFFQPTKKSPKDPQQEKNGAKVPDRLDVLPTGELHDADRLLLLIRRFR